MNTGASPAAAWPCSAPIGPTPGACRRGANFPAGDYLAASAGFAGRSDPSDRRLRSRDPGDRRRCLSSARGDSRREQQAYATSSRWAARNMASICSRPWRPSGALRRGISPDRTTSQRSVTRRHDRQIQGALRRHRELSGFAGAVFANFGIPDNPRFLAVAPISHVAGTRCCRRSCAAARCTVRGFDPEAVLAAIARERINFTLLVPTMIYVPLDHPALSKTDLSSLELLLYGASPISPSRLFEGLERIGPVFSRLTAKRNAIRSPFCASRTTVETRRNSPFRAVFPSKGARSRFSTTPIRRSPSASPARSACVRLT